jgi:hypothetical protein
VTADVDVDVDVDMNIDVDDNIVVCSDNDYLIDCVIIDLGKLTFTLECNASVL